MVNFKLPKILLSFPILYFRSTPEQSRLHVVKPRFVILCETIEVVLKTLLSATHSKGSENIFAEKRTTWFYFV